MDTFSPNSLVCEPLGMQRYTERNIAIFWDSQVDHLCNRSIWDLYHVQLLESKFLT